MRSDNLQLPCVQPQTSSYTSNFLIVAVVIMVAMVIVVLVVMVVRTGQDGTGWDGTGQDGTEQNGTGQNRHLNLTIQVTRDWQLSQFLRCFRSTPVLNNNTIHKGILATDARSKALNQHISWPHSNIN